MKQFFVNPWWIEPFMWVLRRDYDLRCIRSPSFEVSDKVLSVFWSLILCWVCHWSIFQITSFFLFFSLCLHLKNCISNANMFKQRISIVEKESLIIFWIKMFEIIWCKLYKACEQRHLRAIYRIFWAIIVHFSCKRRKTVLYF